MQLKILVDAQCGGGSSSPETTIANLVPGTVSSPQPAGAIGPVFGTTPIDPSFLWLVTCLKCGNGTLEVQRTRIRLPPGAKIGPIEEETVGEICANHPLIIRWRTVRFAPEIVETGQETIELRACATEPQTCPESRMIRVPRPAGSPPSTQRALIVHPITSVTIKTTPCPGEPLAADWGITIQQKEIVVPSARVIEEKITVHECCFCCLPDPYLPDDSPYPYPYPYPGSGSCGCCDRGEVKTSGCSCISESLIATCTSLDDDPKNNGAFETTLHFSPGESDEFRQIWNGTPNGKGPIGSIRLVCDGFSLHFGCARFFLQIDGGLKQPVDGCSCDPFYLRWDETTPLNSAKFQIEVTR